MNSPTGVNQFKRSERSAFRVVGTSEAPVPTPVTTFLNPQQPTPSQSAPIFQADSRWLTNNLAQHSAQARDWFPGGGNVYAPSPIQQVTPGNLLGQAVRNNNPLPSRAPASYLPPATMTMTTAGQTFDYELPAENEWEIVPRNPPGYR